MMQDAQNWIIEETIAAYRFLNHEGITHTEILAPHIKAAQRRINKEKIVLIPQDTTEITFKVEILDLSKKKNPIVG